MVAKELRKEGHYSTGSSAGCGHTRVSPSLRMARIDVSSDSRSDTLVEVQRLPLPLPPSERHTTGIFVPEETPNSLNGMALSTPVASLRDNYKEKNSLNHPNDLSITVAGINTEWGRQEVAKVRGDFESLKLASSEARPTVEKDGTCDADLYSKRSSRQAKSNGSMTQSTVVRHGQNLAFNPSLNATNSRVTNYTMRVDGAGGRPRTQLSELFPLVTNNSAQGGPLGCGAETHDADTTWLFLTILGMSPLHPNTSIVHPFVRMWLVNGVTGDNLIESGSGVAPFVVTHPVDLRLRGTRAPWWGAEFTLRVNSRVVRDVSCNAVFLLEVLDVGTETIHGFPLRRDGLYPICWGFLKLHDVHGRLNVRDRLLLQMFPFPQRTSCFTRLMQMLPSFCFPNSSSFSTQTIWTGAGNMSPLGANSFRAASDAANQVSFTNGCPPEIFFVYRNSCNRKVPHSTGMLISLKEFDKGDYRPRETPIFPYEEYLLNQLSVPEEIQPNSLVSMSHPSPRMRRTRDALLCLINTDALSKLYIREKRERVVPPTVLLQRVQIRGRVSCVAFADGGTVVAMGVTFGFEHIVQLRHVFMPEIPVIGMFRGHAGYIHHLAFCNDGKLLLSCSSDKTVRVWRCDIPSSPMEANTVSESNCLCTLPHSFPVYNGIFYKRHIITCGYDPRMFVWSYNKDPSEKPEKMNLDAALRRTSRQESQRIPSGSVMSKTGFLSSSETDSLRGELVYVTSGDDGAIICSVCASQCNRVWSVDVLGNVLVWRVLFEDTNDGKRMWKMSVRHRLKCNGATSVEARGGRVLVRCANLPVVYLFDASNYQLMHEVALHQRPYVPALTLLPDGEAIVAGTKDGKLLSWECASGKLCTPIEGYGKVQVNFLIRSIVWSGDQQLCLILGTEGGVGYVNSDANTHMTFVAIVGTPRTTESVILCNDAHASDYFCSRFGGELTAQQGSRKFARENSVAASVTTGETRRFSHVSLAPDENVSGKKLTRMGQIIALWKGIVGQHRHLKQRDVDEVQPHPAEVYIVDDS
ncbi:putative jouberin-like [Trypanosoma rangeli]|uniref:Putative jouberin-like n=1 Tax=Trypanosoma rangeli TaxID=5698 RepID=A0A3R7NTR8_TRYRA|nr:putative jouberin-like [Trypanosoma rangeli]RNF11547.1 putative jouberin-like [Trypanosoma rangeli]|eukprot:RNF11547.1 putative jouberin-like [Trypanosoma rangeli]